MAPSSACRSPYALVLALLLLLAPTAAAAADTRTVVRDDATLRTSQGFDSAPVATLRPGTTVEVVDRQREWLRVKAPDGATGWIHEIYLSLPAIASAPAPSASGAGDDFGPPPPAGFVAKPPPATAPAAPRTQAPPATAEPPPAPPASPEPTAALDAEAAASEAVEPGAMDGRDLGAVTGADEPADEDGGEGAAEDAEDSSDEAAGEEPEEAEDEEEEASDEEQEEGEEPDEPAPAPAPAPRQRVDRTGWPEAPRFDPGAASRIAGLDASRRESGRTAVRRPRPTVTPPAWPVSAVQGADDLDSCRDRLLTCEAHLARANTAVAAAEDERDAAKAEAFRAAARTPVTEAGGALEARLERATVALVAAQAEARAAREDAEASRAGALGALSGLGVAELAVRSSEADLQRMREQADATVMELGRTRSELAAALDRAAKLEAELARRPAPTAARPVLAASSRRLAEPGEALAAAPDATRVQAAHEAQLRRLEEQHAREIEALEASHEEVYGRFIELVTKRHEEELARKAAEIEEAHASRLVEEKQRHFAEMRAVSRDTGWERDLEAAVRSEVAVQVEEAKLRWDAKKRGDAHDLQLALKAQGERLERECEARRVADVTRASEEAGADALRRLAAARAEADLRCQRALEIVLERAAAGEDVSRARELLPPAESRTAAGRGEP